MSDPDKNLIIDANHYVPLYEIIFTFVRSSGPGGQNVNKVNSQAQLHWDIEANQSLPTPTKNRLLTQAANRINKHGILRIDCGISRDREKNRLECLKRLKEMIALATVVPVPRKRRKKPRWAIEKRLKNKREKSKLKRLRRPPSLD